MPSAVSRGSTITLTGHFNPLILQPDWLLAQHLITEEEHGESLQSGSQLLTADFVRGQYPNFRFDVFRDSMTVSSVAETRTPVLVKDFAEQVARLLPHTPVHQVEIAHTADLQTDAQEVLGRFAQADAWADVPELARPEVSTVTFSAAGDDVVAEVTVETSDAADFDVFVVLALSIDADGNATGEWAADQLAARWDPSVELADRVLEAVRR